MRKALRLGGIVLIIALSGTATAQYGPLQWDQTGIPIRQGYHIEWQRSAEQDAAGNVIYTWSDTRLGDRDVYAQKIGPNGQKLWGEGGILVIGYSGRQEDPSLIPTSDGNYIFIWNDFRDDITKGDLYAQKLNANGVVQWNPDGVLLSTGDFDSPAVFRIVADIAGGAVIIWDDLRNGDLGDIYAIRVDANGNRPPEWPVNGMEIMVAPAGQRQLTVDTDGAGGAIVGWVDDQSTITGSDIYAQRITMDAQLLWGASGLTICQQNGEQSSPKLCPDGSGGVYITWVDKRSDTQGDLYFHHVTSNGTLSFTTYPQGKPLIVLSGAQIEPRIVYDGSGKAIIVWMDQRNTPLVNDIYTQKVDASGQLFWGTNGTAVCTESSNQTQARINADETGGVICTWMDERDGNENPHNNIFAQKITSSGGMAWTANGVPVSEANGFQDKPLVRSFSNYSLIAWGDERSGSIGIYYQMLNNSTGAPQLTTDGDKLIWGISGNAKNTRMIQNNQGDFFIFFQDLREGIAGFTAYLQIINAEGQIQLAQDGNPICPDPEYVEDKGQEWIDACSDGGSGVIAVWEDHRDANDASAQIYAQRINSEGMLLWGGAGIQVSPFHNQQNKPQIVADKSGGGIIAWTEQDDYYINMISAARITHDGDVLWSVLVMNTPWQDDILEDLAPDGSGGAYLCYQVGDWEDIDLSAQRLDASGNLLWGLTGIPLCNINGNQTNCKVIGLGSEGAIFLWEDQRNGPKDIYAQKISADGMVLWETNGRVINNQPQEQSSIGWTLDGQGNILVVWEDFRNGNDNDVYIQKLTLDGNLLFPASGLLVSAAIRNQSNPYINTDGMGGGYVFWEDFRTGEGEDIYGIHLDEDGAPTVEFTWITDGNIVNDAYQKQNNPEAITDQANGSIVIWEDKRSSGKEEVINLYVQRVNGYASPEMGTIHTADAVASPFRLSAPHPNPFNLDVSFQLQMDRAGMIRIAIYDLLGRQVEVLKDGYQLAGVQTITWQGKGYSSGFYIARLEVEDQTCEQKLILLK